MKKEKKKKKCEKILRELTIMLDKYIIYNQQFEIAICQICKAGITDGIQLHFQRNHILDISLEIRQKITAYVGGLIVRPVHNVSIPSHEIEAIEGIKVIQGFKCTAGFGCHKLQGTAGSIEKHCRMVHDWNSSKGDMNVIIY